MATDNKGVMVYLPSDLEEVLEKYCTENKITRKNKDGEPVPSMGTGIVHYLRSHLLGEVPSNVPNGFTLDDVRSLIDQAIDPLTSDLVNIQSQIIDQDNWDDLKSDVADLRQTLEVLASVKGASIDKPKPAPRQRVALEQRDKETSDNGQPNRVVMTVIKRMIDAPELKTLAETALADGLRGKALIDHLFEQGYGANTNSKPFDSSVGSRFQPAIEYLNSINNGAETDG
jgi:hypothetical protein